MCIVYRCSFKLQLIPYSFSLILFSDVWALKKYLLKFSFLCLLKSRFLRCFSSSSLSASISSSSVWHRSSAFLRFAIRDGVFIETKKFISSQKIGVYIFDESHSWWSPSILDLLWPGCLKNKVLGVWCLRWLMTNCDLFSAEQLSTIFTKARFRQSTPSSSTSLSVWSSPKKMSLCTFLSAFAHKIETQIFFRTSSPFSTFV